MTPEAADILANARTFRVNADGMLAQGWADQAGRAADLAPPPRHGAVSNDRAVVAIVTAERFVAIAALLIGTAATDPGTPR